MLLVVGLIFGALLVGLIMYLRSRDIALTWYEWLIGIAGFALLLFTIQNIIGCLAEFESTAAVLFLPITGIPALILLIVAWQLAWRRNKA